MAHQPLLTQILSLHGRWRADRPALVTQHESLDWRTLDRRVNQVANGLIAAGCGRGGPVGVVMNNGAATVEIMLGTMKAGAAVAPLNTSVPDAGLDAMLADAGVNAVFATPEHARRLLKSSPAPMLRISASGDGDPAPQRNWICYETWRDAQSSRDPAIPLTRQDLCSIIYSSGTTGRPKGIAHGARSCPRLEVPRQRSNIDLDGAVLEHQLGQHAANAAARRHTVCTLRL
jgi:acyl-CoA synthetase (AMP-forming)/AMP-acid ligase II